jgi:hypothetical protein
MGKIRYGTDELSASIPALKQAETDFAGYNAQYLKGITAVLEPFNSDFVGQAAKATSVMEDTKAVALQNALAEYRAAVEYAIAETKQLDDGLGAQSGKTAAAVQKGDGQ